MALKMAQPWRDPKTGVFHLRQRTPRDLLARLKGTTVTLPVGDEVATVRVGDMVQVSLRTREGREAKPLHAAADAALRRFWEAQRNGPARLTHKQAVALAGVLYREFTAAHDEEPGDPETWLLEHRDDLLARYGQLGRSALKIGTPARQEGAREERFGALADALLAREGLVVDADSRTRLVEALAQARAEATLGLYRMAGGDYSPDPVASRFPAWQRPEDAPPRQPADLITVDTLFERWSAYQADKRATSTVRRYGASLRSLAAFTQGRDIRSIIGDDIHAWAEHRRENEGVSARVVNKNDLVAASSVFAWAAKRQGGQLVAANPVAGISLDEPRTAATRERAFRADEVTAILKAALTVRPDPENPTWAHARRWAPWLAAYSGARISELTDLHREDIRSEGGVPVMDLKRTKTGEPRTVPLHPHLVEMGFVDFVKASKAGPLFYDPKRHKPGAKTTPGPLRGQKVAAWVRETVKLDMAVDPNHGWRHTFKTQALGAGIEERIRDAITGHRVGSVARKYESPPLATLAAAMQRFPRYNISG